MALEGLGRLTLAMLSAVHSVRCVFISRSVAMVLTCTIASGASTYRGCCCCCCCLGLVLSLEAAAATLCRTALGALSGCCGCSGMTRRSWHSTSRSETGLKQSRFRLISFFCIWTRCLEHALKAWLSPDASLKTPLAPRLPRDLHPHTKLDLLQP